MQDAECRARPLPPGAKFMSGNMPGFGIEGWAKRRVMFTFRRMGSSSILQGISLAKTNGRLKGGTPAEVEDGG